MGRKTKIEVNELQWKKAYTIKPKLLVLQSIQK